ncbi:MAG: CDP-alcohol phosphatidyltransferase family protein [Specibacter sp.]
MSRSVADASGRGRYRDAVALLGGAQKKRARGAPAYSIYVNRPFGRRLAAGAHLLGLTPNAVSLISAAFTFSAIVLVAVRPPTVWLGLFITAFLVLGYAFDSADGQLARLRGGGTAAGEWLDHVLDCLKCSTLHLAVLITMFVNFGLNSLLWLLVPIGFSVVAAVSFFASILNDQLKARYAGSTAAAGPKSGTPLRAVLGIPTDYGVLCLSFLLLGWPALFLVVYTILFVANFGYLAAASIKWFGDMKRLN